MTAALRRLSALASQLAGLDTNEYIHRHNIHQLSPTHFLPRAAAIEPNAICVYHTTANGKRIRYTYAETSARAAGLAYYLKKRGLKRTHIKIFSYTRNCQENLSQEVIWDHIYQEMYTRFST